MTLTHAAPLPDDSAYESRVSFDTFDNRDATDFSFTLKSKHKAYAYTKRSRTFLCGTDQNDYSEFALEWLLEELVDDGDEVVCLRVVDKDSKLSSDSSVEEGRYRMEAHKLMDQIKAKNNDEKSINLVLEFAVGKVQDTIQRMIAIYEPACLIVGTRGRSLGGIQGLLPGSVSKYCLQNSPVPVIVVRPQDKREKKKRKRVADPNRRAYMNMLQQNGAATSGLLDRIEKGEFHAKGGTAADNEKEAQAVARAIGLPTVYSDKAASGSRRSSVDVSVLGGENGAPLTKITSVRSDYTSGQDSPSPQGGMSPDPAFEFQEEMRSPDSLGGLDDEDESPERGAGDGDGDGDENLSPFSKEGDPLSQRKLASTAEET
ncbi:hypothetical protein MMC25_007542 [Agyrium rufum]|nr:hypothetical protein [Agyrium rufum]